MHLFLVGIAVIEFWGAVVWLRGFPGAICRQKLMLVLACPVERGLDGVANLAQAGTPPDLDVPPDGRNALRKVDCDLELVEL